MYEQALRLSQEPHSLTMLSRQTYCLLACINTLHMINEKYRWIVRPTADQNLCTNDVFRRKRSFEGTKILQYKVKQRIEVLELNDIKKEYILTEAKLKLAKHNSNNYVSVQISKIFLNILNFNLTCPGCLFNLFAGPSEIVALMSSVGFYIQALEICEHFNINKVSVLESLASQCANLSQKDHSKTWDWLSRNSVFG